VWEAPHAASTQGDEVIRSTLTEAAWREPWTRGARFDIRVRNGSDPRIEVVALDDYFCANTVAGRLYRRPAAETRAAASGRLLSRASPLAAWCDGDHQCVELRLNLRHALHLDIQLLIDVIEVRHHHIEHVVFMKRPGETLRAFPTGLPDFPAPSDGAGLAPWAFRSAPSAGSSVSSRSLATFAYSPVGLSLRHSHRSPLIGTIVVGVS
jgi:hypothetical protein